MVGGRAAQSTTSGGFGNSGTVMRYNKSTIIWRVVCLSFLVCIKCFAISLPSIPQLTERVSHLTNKVRDAAEELHYRSMAGNQIPDQWVAARQQGELVDYAYLTLFGADSDNSSTSIKGRIGVTVLAFKNEEISKRKLLELKAQHGANMGFKVISERSEGFLIEDVNGVYAAIKMGADVLLLEDRSRMQRKTIETLSESVAKNVH